MESRKFHSTSIVFEDNGLMILGKSGSGKSDLALRLIDSGATLISDDITICRKINSQIFLFSPEETKGLLEVREVGIITVPYVENIRLNLVARLVDEEITSSSITDAILSKAGSNLKEINLFDIYTGKGIPEGEKSLTYSLSWQAVNRTLTDDEVDKIIVRIVSFLSKKFNAKLRA